MCIRDSAYNAAQEFRAAREVAAAALEQLGQPTARLHGDLWYELLYAAARKDVRDLAAYLREAQRSPKSQPSAAWAHRNVALVFYYTEADRRCRAALAQ